MRLLYSQLCRFRASNSGSGCRGWNVSRQSPDASGREIPAEAAGRVQAPGGRGIWAGLLYHQPGWEIGAAVPDEGVGSDRSEDRATGADRRGTRGVSEGDQLLRADG